jgi:hypothetical protein
MSSEKMLQIFNRSINDYHVKDQVDQNENNPYEIGSLEYLLYRKNWIDTIQWHLEDIIREPSIAPDKALEVKRRIDKSNQNRTDLVEEIDEQVLANYRNVTPKDGARVNTESPGWAIDRLSILALKIYHMAIEAEREDIEAYLQQKNQNKLAILNIQKDDLSQAINQLMEDLANGERLVKVYRQMKMYNDPELNPVLYKKK